MFIHEKDKITPKKGFNPLFKGINPEKWPKILICVYLTSNICGYVCVMLGYDAVRRGLKYTFE